VDAAKHERAPERHHGAERLAEQRHRQRHRRERLEIQEQPRARGAEPRDSLLPEPLAKRETGNGEVEQRRHAARRERPHGGEIRGRGKEHAGEHGGDEQDGKRDREGIAAARQIAAAIARDNADRRATGQAPIRLRIGLHTGPAIVGNIGAPGRVNYTIVGDTVNVAQRIEQVAKEVIAEDEVAVLLSEVTRQALAADVETHDMGPRPLRGRDEPVGVHRLVL